LWNNGIEGWFAFIALLGSVLMLGKETVNATLFWNRSMGIK